LITRYEINQWARNESNLPKYKTSKNINRFADANFHQAELTFPEYLGIFLSVTMEIRAR
jgi:hypothetical protein